MESPPPTPTASPPRETLVDRLRAELRLRHYSPRTEEAYVWWLRRFVRFHQRKHPRSMGAPQISAFLTQLAERGVSASTQNQARSALLFVYAAVLKMPIVELGEVVVAQRPARLPVVLTRAEVSAVLRQLTGVPWLMASLMYGAGLRLMECAELRVKDVDLQRAEVVVRDGKGGKDRVTPLPALLRQPLTRHLATVRAQHTDDCRGGRGAVALPGQLRLKYPRAPWEWSWQWVFPATRGYVDRETGEQRRHHLHESVVQRAVKEAVRAAGITKMATCHTFSPLVCDAPPGIRLRHPDHPGVARPSRRQHDDGVYARAEPGWTWGAESARPAPRA